MNRKSFQILEEESVQFRIADMSSGKAVDDGYRGVHVYYQKSGKYYPIEIQFNTLFDRQLNNWLHDYLYKKSYPIETGCIMREKYKRIMEWFCVVDMEVDGEYEQMVNIHLLKQFY